MIIDHGRTLSHFAWSSIHAESLIIFIPGQEWSRGFAEDKKRRLVRKHLPYSQGLTMIIVISWWFVMIMLMMSLCPNSWWWCCLRSSVSACDDGDVALTSPEALFCNQNYTFTDRGRLQAKALLVPTTTSALKTSCHLLYTQHRLRSLLIIYLFVYSFDGLSSKAEYLTFVGKPSLLSSP